MARPLMVCAAIAAFVSLAVGAQELRIECYEESGRLLVPIRAIGEALGATVRYGGWGGDLAVEPGVGSSFGTPMPELSLIFTHLGEKPPGMRGAVEVCRGGHTVILVENHRTAYRYDENLELDVPPRNVAGHVYLPLRFVAETLGRTVDYQGDRIVLTSDGQDDVVLLIQSRSPVTDRWRQE